MQRLHRQTVTFHYDTPTSADDGATAVGSPSALTGCTLASVQVDARESVEYTGSLHRGMSNVLMSDVQSESWRRQVELQRASQPDAATQQRLERRFEEINRVREPDFMGYSFDNERPDNGEPILRDWFKNDRHHGTARGDASRMTDEQVLVKIDAYGSAWAGLLRPPNYRGLSNEPLPMRYWDVPWPLLFTPEDIDDINEKAILDFLAHPARVPDSAITIRDPTTQEDIQDNFNRVLEHIAMRNFRTAQALWKPRSEAFNANVMARVHWVDKEKVMRSAVKVEEVLIEMSNGLFAPRERRASS